MLSNIKIIAIDEDEYEDRSVKLFDKFIDELTKEERKEVARDLEYEYAKDNYELEQDLKRIFEKLPRQSLKKILADQGFLPANEAEKIENLSVNTDVFYYSESLYSDFTPTKKDAYNTEKALKANKFFAEITFGKNHPFEIARQAYKKKQAEKQAKITERRKQKEIEKAKKLLKEQGELK